MGLTSLKTREGFATARAEIRARRSPVFKIQPQQEFEIANSRVSFGETTSFDLYSKRKRKVVAQARRPILKNRPDIPKWIVGMASLVFVLLISGLFVSAAIIVINLSSGKPLSSIGASIVFVSIATGVVAISRVKRRLLELG